MKPVVPDPPAIVLKASSLSELAARITTLHAAAEETNRKSLQHYREVGKMLIAAKAKCSHGKWLPWLKANVPFSRTHAARYMRLAKCAVTAHLEEQWQIILHNAPEDDELEPPIVTKPTILKSSTAHREVVPSSNQVSKELRDPVLHKPEEGWVEGVDYIVVPSECVTEEDESPKDYFSIHSLHRLATEASDNHEFESAAAYMREAGELRGLLEEAGGKWVMRIPLESEPVDPADEEPEPEPTPEESPVSPTIILPVPLDAWGIPIQPHAAEAFEAVPMFDALLAKLHECARDLSVLAGMPGGLFLPAQFVKTNSKAGGKRVLAALDNAISDVERAKPAVTDCPYVFNEHQPHDREGFRCPVCRNKRWSGTLRSHQIPPVMTAAMKAHYGVTEASRSTPEVSPVNPTIILPVPLDSWGIPIQPHAAEAFETTAELQELISLVSKAHRLFNQVASKPGGKFLTLVSSYRRGAKQDDGSYADRFVHEGLELALKNIKASVPMYTVCPYRYADAPHPDNCRTCLGLNWTPELSPSIPPVCIDRAKAAFGIGGGK